MRQKNMVPVGHAGKIDITTWGFEPGDGVEVWQEALVRTFEEQPPRLSFPFEWGFDGDGRNGPPVAPLTMFLELPLGENTDDGPEWQISLADVALDMIRLHQGEGEKVRDPEGVAIIREFTRALRRLAERMDAYIEVPQPEAK